MVPEDLRTLGESMSGQVEALGEECARVDDGKRLTYVLNLDWYFHRGVPLAPAHAGRGVQVLWIDRALQDLPRLRVRLDGYHRSIRHSGAAPPALGVFVSQEPLPPQTLAALTSLGRVRPGVSATDVMAGLQPRQADTVGLESVPVLGTLVPADFQKVWSTMDREHRWLLGGGWAVEDGPEQRTHLVDLSEAEHSAAPFSILLRRAYLSAVWIDLEGMEPLQLGRIIDTLGRWADAAGRRLRRLPVYVPQQDVDPAIGRLLEGRFGKVRYGWPARRVLRPSCETNPDV